MNKSRGQSIIQEEEMSQTTIRKQERSGRTISFNDEETRPGAFLILYNKCQICFESML